MWGELPLLPGHGVGNIASKLISGSSSGGEDEMRSPASWHQVMRAAEQIEAGTTSPASLNPIQRRSRPALMLTAAVALAAVVACGVGATAAASTASARSRQSFGAAARTAVGAAAESLTDQEPRAQSVGTRKPDRPKRGLGLSGSSLRR